MGFNGTIPHFLGSSNKILITPQVTAADLQQEHENGTPQIQIKYIKTFVHEY